VRLSEIQREFEADYRAMLKGVLALGKSVAVCTVYDSVPGLRPEQRTALSAWNDVILRQAFAAKLPVIDLRLVCSDARDYSGVSPIEPSEIGGGKIVGAIRHLLLSDDPRVGTSRVYAS
ncbi:MAG TPA: hypothetical protein VLJ39_02285, partial [Tepidisphaeraceae bacterium]|nr:hypothetical protein [Tepidisphaeraceae bacterium]